MVYDTTVKSITSLQKSAHHISHFFLRPSNLTVPKVYSTMFYHLALPGINFSLSFLHKILLHWTIPNWFCIRAHKAVCSSLWHGTLHNDKTPFSLLQLRGIHNNNQKVIGLNPLSDQVITNKSSLISPLLEEQLPCG